MKFYIYKDILDKFDDRVIITNETAASLYNLGDHHLDEYIDLYTKESDKTIEQELIEEFKEYFRWKFEITHLPDHVFDEGGWKI